MQLLKRLCKAGSCSIIFLLFSGSAIQAAGIALNGAPEEIAGSQSAFITQALNSSPAAITPAASAPRRAVASGARIYNFKTLYASLGYPDPSYFGSTEEEIMDLESYTSKYDTFYQEVNDYLRFYPKPYTWYGTSPEVAQSMVDNMDRIFARVPALPSDLILFRGIDLKFLDAKAYALNEEFTDKGYVSTSLSFKVANYFNTINDKAAGKLSSKAVFVIYSNPGEKGILIDQKEDEVILGHGRNFRVMALRETAENYTLYLIQNCSGPCAVSLREDVGTFWNNFKPQ